MHPQTLRKYERLGFVQPTRTVGSMRVYSREELERLRLIKHLVDEAIRLHEPLEAFLRQAKEEVSSLTQGYQQLEQILGHLETER